MDEFDFSGTQFNYIPENYAPNASQPQASGVSLSQRRLWYAAFVPLIALFIEIYANSFWLGVLVWVCAALSAIIACLLDRKYLIFKKVDVSKLNPITSIIPPLYIFKRSKITDGKFAPAVVFCFTFFYALVLNGFTAAATISEDDMISQVRYNYWYNISGFENDSNAAAVGYIGDILDEYYGTDDSPLEWTAEKNGSEITVEVKNDTGTVNLVFEIGFDGYAYDTINLEEITISGKTLTGSKAQEKVAKLLEKYVKEKANKTTESKAESTNSENLKSA